MQQPHILLRARKNSERVPNKLLRPFAGSCLFDICLDKLEDEDLKPQSIIAVGDDEMIVKAHERGFRVVLRDEHSLNGELAQDVDNFMPLEGVSHIVDLDCCHPFLTVGTIKTFVADYTRMVRAGVGQQGLIAVVKTPCWYFYGEPGRERIINSDAALANTKLMRPAWKSANALYGYEVRYYLSTWKYWTFKPGCPQLFPMSELEAVDIDTPEDFEEAERRYIECHA